MRKITGKVVGIVLAALAPVAGQAQDDAATMQAAQGELDHVFSAVGAFVGDVRFDEADVTSLIDLWEEWNEFGDQQQDDEDDAIVDFESILANSDYRRWAASHGLDADDWMRKTTRITMALYREQMLAAAEEMPAQMAQQLEMIEQQREQLGEEMYHQIKQGMEETAEYSKSIMTSARKLPKATAAEQVLLDKYRDELVRLLESDDDNYDEYEDYEQYEDDGDYDDEEP